MVTWANTFAGLIVHVEKNALGEVRNIYQGIAELAETLRNEGFEDAKLVAVSLLAKIESTAVATSETLQKVDDDEDSWLSDYEALFRTMADGVEHLLTGSETVDSDWDVDHIEHAIAKAKFLGRSEDLVSACVKTAGSLFDAAKSVYDAFDLENFPKARNVIQKMNEAEIKVSKSKTVFSGQITLVQWGLECRFTWSTHDLHSSPS